MAEPIPSVMEDMFPSEGQNFSVRNYLNFHEPTVSVQPRSHGSEGATKKRRTDKVNHGRFDNEKAFPYKDLDWRAEVDLQIRILILLPAKNLSDDISCQMVDAFINDRVQYETLSYAWGDPSDSLSINLQGYTVSVTRNLDIALRYLRHSDRERRLWIDALCINQQDDSEKSMVVRQMHCIYNHASTTNIWIGEPSADSDSALDIIEAAGWMNIDAGTHYAFDETLESVTKIDRDEMIAALDTGTAAFESAGWTDLATDGWEDELPILRDRGIAKRLEAGEQWPPGILQRWEALGNLFARPWFSRVWVIQEVAFSPKCELVCGHRRILWTVLYWGRESLLRATRAFRPYLSLSLCEDLSKMQTIYFMTGLRQAMIERQDRQLPDMLAATRIHAATDPRDKIYGIWNLLSLEPTDFRIDYSKSAAQVLLECAFSIINQNKNLSILSECEGQDHEDIAAEHFTHVESNGTNDTSRLPSWVPDWTQLKMTAPMAGDYTLSSSSCNPYRASGDSSAQFKFVHDCSQGCSRIICRTRGIAVDRVVETGGDPYDQTKTAFLNNARMVLMNSPHRSATEKLFGSNLEETLWQTLLRNRTSGGEFFPNLFDDQTSPLPFNGKPVEIFMSESAFELTIPGRKMCIDLSQPRIRVRSSNMELPLSTKEQVTRPTKHITLPVSGEVLPKGMVKVKHVDHEVNGQVGPEEAVKAVNSSSLGDHHSRSPSSQPRDMKHSAVCDGCDKVRVLPVLAF